MLLKEILDKKELNLLEEILILDNQNKFKTDSQCFRNLKNDLNMIKNNIFKCKGRLESASIPTEAKLPILIYCKRYLFKLIIWDIHRKMKHAGTKQTISELKQKYRVCQSQNYVRNIIRKCLTCRKLLCKLYNYPKTPSLTKLRLADTQPSSTTGIGNFGPVYVQNMFNKNDCAMRKVRKVWVTLYTCALTRNIILDVVPSLSVESFIRSFRCFMSRRGCPDNIISDNGKNFVSKDSQNFLSNLNVGWLFNLPLDPWHGGFFERLVRSVEDLLKKDLQNNKLTYEEMQAVLLEVEMIIVKFSVN